MIGILALLIRILLAAALYVFGFCFVFDLEGLKVEHQYILAGQNTWIDFDFITRQ